MAASKRASSRGREATWELRPRWRVQRGRDIALGPGKADLLDAIASSGSLAAAARSLGMSYTRAWRLVQVMNDVFASPLVTLARGGEVKGGATLTARGESVLQLYREIERASSAAAGAQARALARHLR